MNADQTNRETWKRPQPIARSFSQNLRRVRKMPIACIKAEALGRLPPLRDYAPTPRPVTSTPGHASPGAHATGRLLWADQEVALEAQPKRFIRSFQFEAA